jgi:tetraacyldisaccharide-1-P 4'-kinase
MGVEVRVGMAVFYRVRVKGNCFIGGAGKTLVQSGLLLTSDSSKY